MDNISREWTFTHKEGLEEEIIIEDVCSIDEVFDIMFGDGELTRGEWELTQIDGRYIDPIS